MNELISELVGYGIEKGLVEEDDKIYVINRLLELFRLDSYTQTDKAIRQLSEILSDMTDDAAEHGLIPENTNVYRDLFDTKIMGILTPAPSVVRAKFTDLYVKNPKKATDFYYQFSQDTNYIRKDRVARDKKWKADTQYGKIDITINLSKPEKDPRDIARAATQAKNDYPKCLLCAENEGYAGTLSHPARQNHRIIPLKLDGQDYYMQYSPYVYYNEHCIVFNAKHTPMKIDEAVFVKLLDFVRQFPHYTLGSNADLPIVGGSILSHDHFQGGHYEFAMAKAPVEKEPETKGNTAYTIRAVGPDNEVLKETTGKADKGDSIALATEAFDGYTRVDGQPATGTLETDGQIFHIFYTKDGQEEKVLGKKDEAGEKSLYTIYHVATDGTVLKKEEHLGTSGEEITIPAGAFDGYEEADGQTHTDTLKPGVSAFTVMYRTKAESENTLSYTIRYADMDGTVLKEPPGTALHGEAHDPGTGIRRGTGDRAPVPRSDPAQ